MSRSQAPLARGVRVLVVDDDPLLVSTLQEALELRGHVTRAASSGDAALELIADDHLAFDCLLMDVNMPGLDGLTALRIVRRLAPDLPVILMSGEVSAAQAREADAHGAYAILPKPFDLDLLLRFLALVGREEDVLVVGGDPAGAGRLETVLGAAGYRVETEREPERVLERMERGYKLAVLVDAALGGEGAQRVVETIRARYPTKPVLRMSGPGEGPPRARDLSPAAAAAWTPWAQPRAGLLDTIGDIRRIKLAAVLAGAAAHPPRPPRITA